MEMLRMLRWPRARVILNGTPRSLAAPAALMLNSQKVLRDLLAQYRRHKTLFYSNPPPSPQYTKEVLRKSSQPSLVRVTRNRALAGCRPRSTVPPRSDVAALGWSPRWAGTSRQTYPTSQALVSAFVKCG